MADHSLLSDTRLVEIGFYKIDEGNIIMLPSIQSIKVIDCGSGGTSSLQINGRDVFYGDIYQIWMHYNAILNSYIDYKSFKEQSKKTGVTLRSPVVPLRY